MKLKTETKKLQILKTVYVLNLFILLNCSPRIKIDFDDATPKKVAMPIQSVSRIFAWDANPANQNLVGYKIYFGSADGVYDGACATNPATLSSPITVLLDDLDDINNPEYTVDGLKANTPCYFSISAYRGTVESSWALSIFDDLFF